MTITNDRGLPDILYKAIIKREAEHDNPSVISPSSMTDPIRAIILKRRHWDDLAVDASTMVWSLFGSTLHAIIADQDSGKNLVEHQMECTIDVDGEPQYFRGTLDLYQTDEAILNDFKVTSAWTIVYGSRMEDWQLQQNAYRYLLGISGLPVKRMRIWALLRDWSRAKARSDPDYPQRDLVSIDIPEVGVHDFMVDKIRNIRLASEMEDNELPYCTEKERWAQPDKWALMKTGRKSAVKVYDTEEEAQEGLSWGKGDSIEYRPGKSNRCVEYCAAFPFCNQAQEEFGD